MYIVMRRHYAEPIAAHRTELEAVGMRVATTSPLLGALLVLGALRVVERLAMLR